MERKLVFLPRSGDRLLLPRPQDGVKETLRFYPRDMSEISDNFFSMTPPTPPRPSPAPSGIAKDLEEDLRAYLRDAREANVAHRLSQLLEAYQEHDKMDVKRHEELVGEMRGHSLRIGELEKDAGIFGAELSATSKNQIEELKEAHRWKDRLVLTVVVGVVVSAFSGGIGALISYLVSRK